MSNLKKSVLFFLLVLGILVLSACGSAAAQSSATDTPSADSGMDEASKLMAGTVLLQSTSTPLETEQINTLLLLWKGYKTVSTSQTAAQAEIDGLISQITEVFSDGQMTAIDGMDLSSDTLTAKLSEAGVEMTAEPVVSTETADVSSSQPVGEMPGGGAPMDGGQMPAGGDPMSGSDVTAVDTGVADAAQAESSAAGLQANSTDTMLVSAVIGYLEELTIS
jgi:hypothetical protein